MKKATTVLAALFFLSPGIRLEAQDEPAFPSDVSQRIERLIQGSRMQPAEAQAVLTALFGVERAKADARTLREKSHVEELAFPGTFAVAMALFLPSFVKPTFPYASLVKAGIRIGWGVASYAIWRRFYEESREYLSQERRALERVAMEHKGLTQLLNQIDTRIGERGP